MTNPAQDLASWLRPRMPLPLLRSPDQALLEVARRWCEGHRYWHGPTHLKQMVSGLETETRPVIREGLLLAALYHDVVYDPASSANEEASVELLLQHCLEPGHEAVRMAVRLIQASKWTQPPAGELERQFFALDTAQLAPEVSLGERLRYETAVFREYQWVAWPVYRTKRAEFLRTWAERFPEHRRGVEECLGLLEGFQPRIAVYPGSFNPFHLGHLSILRQAELIFDKVIVAIGINRQKPGASEATALRQATVQQQLRCHEVTCFGSLLSEYVEQLGYPVSVVRGVRDGTDLEAELRFARFLNELRPGTRVVWISCEAELQHLSSSGIRELESFRPAAGARYVPSADHIYGLTPCAGNSA